MKKGNDPMINDQFLVQFQLLKEAEIRFHRAIENETREFYRDLIDVLIRKMRKKFGKS